MNKPYFYIGAGNSLWLYCMSSKAKGAACLGAWMLTRTEFEEMREAGVPVKDDDSPLVLAVVRGTES